MVDGLANPRDKRSVMVLYGVPHTEINSRTQSMGCLPESGGCERQRTDPFVDHLNKIEKREFVHELCLDQIYRKTPQPEALYIDKITKESLVIERKSISWPLDYPLRHKNDHFVAELLARGLNDLTRDAPYAVELEFGLIGRPDELTAFANQALKIIHEKFRYAESGKALGSSAIGRRWRFFREDAAWRTFEGEPEKGLVVRWSPKGDS